MTTIKRLRVIAEKTVGQAASEVGVSTNTWALWESGRVKPSPHRLVALARTLNCPLEVLIADNEKTGR